MKVLRERRWLDFYNAADQIVWRLAVSEGVAQTMLREACASGVIRSQREPYDPVTKEGQAPPEFVKPSEWSKDQVDLMTDKDGCAFFVDVDEDDFRYWLDKLNPPADPKSDRTPYRQNLVKEAINDLQLPNSLPTPELVKRVSDWHKAKGYHVPSRTTIIRAAGRRK
jgi:hypothetical protein